MALLNVVRRGLVVLLMGTAAVPAQEIRANPNTISFQHAIGKAAPKPVSVLIETTTGAPMAYTAIVSLAAPAKWLSIRPLSSTTPGLLEVRADATGLAPGEYRGAVTILSAASASMAVAVVLTATRPAIVADASPLEFAYVAGEDPPGPKVIGLTCDLPVSYRASVETLTGGDWLSVSPDEGRLPRLVQVTVRPTAVEAGSFAGIITFSDPSGRAEPARVVVIRTVARSASPPSLLVSPAWLNRDGQISVTSSGAPLSFQVTTQSISPRGAADWFSVEPLSGVTPATLKVSSNSTGSQLGLISITSSNGGARAVLVYPLSTTSTPWPLLTSPDRLNLVWQVNGPAPRPAEIVVTAGPGPLVQISGSVISPAGGNWMAVSPATLPGSGAITVSVNPAGLPPGTYLGGITIKRSTETRIAVVQLVVSPVAPLAVSQPSVSVTAIEGGPPPPAAALSVAAAGGSVDFSTEVDSPGGWLRADPPNGAAPCPLTLRFDTSGLAAGKYQGLVRVVPSRAADAAVAVEVTLDVRQASVLSAASNASRLTAPGSLASIYGVQLADRTEAAERVPLPLALGGASVTVNDIPAPLLYASPSQVNLQVPYEIQPGPARTVVWAGEEKRATIEHFVAAAAPGIFGSRGGPLALFNANGTPNDERHPAEPGEIVTAYGTGLGSVDGPIGSGQPAPLDALLRATSRVHIFLGRAATEAEVLFAGLAPNFVGLWQLNFRVPQVHGPQWLTVVAAGVAGDCGDIFVR